MKLQTAHCPSALRSRLAQLTGGDDLPSSMTERDLEVLLASPSTIKNSTGEELQSLASRLGHRSLMSPLFRAESIVATIISLKL
jgi:hypothetical protein